MDIAPQKGKPGNGSRPEPKQTREGQGGRRQVGEPDPKGREPKVWRKSDPLIVLQKTGEPFTGERGGQQSVAGKGNRSRTRKAGTPPANLTAGNSQEGEKRAEAPVSRSVSDDQRADVIPLLAADPEERRLRRG